MIKVIFINIDSMNRPVFKDAKKNYYGCLDTLFSYGTSEAEVLEKVSASDLVYFGSSFDCEPMGTTPANKLHIV